MASVVGDATTPVANEIMDISSYLLIVVCALVLEKSLLTVFGYVSFNILIPIACTLFAISVFAKRSLLRLLSLKIVVFALVLATVIPFSFKISDLVYETNMSTVKALDAKVEGIDSAEDDKKDNNKTWWDKLKDKAKEGTSKVIKKAKDLLNNFIDVIALFIIAYCATTFGDAYIDSIAKEIQNAFPGIKGFNRRGLYRMKQFYETYAGDQFVSALLTQINWTNHLAIMSKAKTMEERHFYITLCVKETYSSRELERQIDSGYYERYMLSQEKLLPEQIKGLKENPFLDSYVIEFLDLPHNFRETDLQKGLIKNMKEFILEVGRDFTFIDEEFKVQVGEEDFRIDLLFFHRGLQCLVAFELKTGKFKPEYISKIDFYLEALDRQKKKENENPSVGIILCALKDEEVVEYAMSRTMSPMMVSEYKLQLPDKAVLQRKLQELINIPLIEE